MTAETPNIDLLTPRVKREFLSMLHDYIGHSTHIYKASELKGREAKLDICRQCSQYIHELDTGKTLNQIARGVISIRKNLGFILPNELNDSYVSSVETLNELLNFCYSVTGYFQEKTD